MYYFGILQAKHTPRKGMIRLILADDHPMIIEGICSALKTQSDFEIIKVVSNGKMLLETLSEEKADVVIMDINMPEMNGIEATQRIKTQFPDVKVIAYSQYDNKHFIKRMLKAGARAYLLKDTGASELIKAIHEVFDGTIYLGKNLPDLYQAKQKKGNGKFDPVISKRELEVLKLICAEYNTNEIADKLFISPHTVESHRSNLLIKSGARNSAGLVKWAIESDLIE